MVEVSGSNLGIWRRRPWAELVRGHRHEAAVNEPNENMAKRTGKVEVRAKAGGWYDLVVDGEVVDTVRGREEAQSVAETMEG